MGFVYFLQAGDTEYFKIGQTSKVDLPHKAIKMRKKAHQTGNPEKLHLFAYIENNFPDVLEAQIHSELQHKRTEGGSEWFRLTKEEATQIVAKYDGQVGNVYEGSGLPPTGLTAFDVRPLRRRQQDVSAGRGEDVSKRTSAFDHASTKPLFTPVRREH